MNLQSVSSLNEQIKSILETTFIQVQVEGEVSRPTYHGSGHLYFTLKDDNSSIKCVMFRANVNKLKFKIKEGDSLIISGAITLYKPRGEYQINCFSLEPSGMGALAFAYERLKKQLQTEGLFEQSRKKNLPKIPSHIVLITSGTSAALQDMLKVSKNRWPLIKISLIDVQVQGDLAHLQIKDAIIRADLMDVDIIVIGRGGGSVEDLWAFNEEDVARAIGACNTPLVCAVGHEIDWVISDYVADLRAPTPSAAMEMILPDSNEVLMQLDSIEQSFNQSIKSILQKSSYALNQQYELFSQYSYENRMKQYNEQLESLKKSYNTHLQIRINQAEHEPINLKQSFNDIMSRILQSKQYNLNSMKESYKNSNPKMRDKIGFAQIVKGKNVVTLSELKVNDTFTLQDSKEIIDAKVISKSKM